MSHSNPGNDTPANTSEPAATMPGAARPPQYKKPAVRRYDQIEQVKPYGPSEMEAG